MVGYIRAHMNYDTRFTDRIRIDPKQKAYLKTLGYKTLAGVLDLIINNYKNGDNETPARKTGKVRRTTNSKFKSKGRIKSGVTKKV